MKNNKLQIVEECIGSCREIISANTYCVPADILGHFGYIVECTTGSERPFVLDILRKLDIERNPSNEGFFIYGLRHLDNDWSFPISISKTILVNRFAWFLSYSEIKELELSSEIDIVMYGENNNIIFSNEIARFYNFYNDLSKMTVTKNYIGCNNIDLYTVISNECKILTMVSNYKEMKNE